MQIPRRFLPVLCVLLLGAPRRAHAVVAPTADPADIPVVSPTNFQTAADPFLNQILYYETPTLEASHVESLQASPWEQPANLDAWTRRLLAATVAHPYFIESHVTRLKHLLGEERFNKLAKRIEILRADQTPLTRERLSLMRGHVAPHLQELDEAIASMGGSFDGGIARPEESPSPVFEPPELAARYNALLTPASYRGFLGTVKEKVGSDIHFHVSDRPFFMPAPLVEKAARYGKEILLQLVGPDYLRLAQAWIPPQFRVPGRGRSKHPRFSMVDFGIVTDERGEPDLRVVEMQGFTSLWAFQALLSRSYIEHFDLDPRLRYLVGDLDFGGFKSLLGRALLGDSAPENVILLEMNPELQKTRSDFIATKNLLGIETVAASELIRRGNKLFYKRDGREIQVERIYNRIIPDDALKESAAGRPVPPFDSLEELDVEWVPHPDWYYLISKVSMLYAQHPSIPRTRSLDKVPNLESLSPEELAAEVLKALFSYSGQGVFVNPTLQDVLNVPAEQRSQWILQQKMNFVPHIWTPFGMTKAELRMMYIWLDEDTEPIPVLTLIRMGRNALMGAGYNNESWAGSSGGLYLPHR